MNPWLLLIPIAIVAATAVASREARASEPYPRLPGSMIVSPPKPYDLLAKVASVDPTVEQPDLTRGLARKWGPIFDVPISWIVSQAYVESRNRPLAVNPNSHATGVLQILMIRARDLVRWIGRSRWRNHPEVRKVLTLWKGRRTDLLHPELNVMLAAFDLRHLRDKFGDDHDLVAAAYNQGEGRIARHLAAGVPMPPRAIEYVSRVRRAKRMGYV